MSNLESNKSEKEILWVIPVAKEDGRIAHSCGYCGTCLDLNKQKGVFRCAKCQRTYGINNEYLGKVTDEEWVEAIGPRCGLCGSRLDESLQDEFPDELPF